MQWLTQQGERFSYAFLEEGRYLAYLNGFKMTILISLGAVIFGVVIGVLLAIFKYIGSRTKKLGFLAVISNIYLTIFRGTPVYVQLLIFYYVVFASVHIPQAIVGVICFGLNSAAYVAEIIRAGIEAVDKGQTEAGRSLGLTGGQTMGLIVMPQAIRNILPALGNEFITLIKETAIIGNIGVLDVTKVGQNISNSNFDFMPPMLIVAVIYLVVVVILTKLLALFERRLARSDRR
ncbi:MAG TPA: amino acid ABC transporter permease [Candidatus Scybalocola faecigallinarum]|uniref:Amino acid ABC transporter permease n=1 Tax=Candidatus Scybalocola faecigallinarum TaxID=2840941 RepID=A0A9D1F3L2_9FIRM|nr:amino acid ABC transporter permease [Candidatus Scybalocola faecigallinarum]